MSKVQTPFLPRNIISRDCRINSGLFKDITPRMRDVALDLFDMGWSFHVVKSNWAWCIYAHRTITIASSIFAHGNNAKNWMLSHEMAHVIAGHRAKHGPIFMQELKLICPPESIDFEVLYKPVHALKAGIGCFDF